MMVQCLHNLTFVSNHSQNQKLWQACYSGDLAAVNDALGKGADINWNNPNHQVDLYNCSLTPDSMLLIDVGNNHNIYTGYM